MLSYVLSLITSLLCYTVGILLIVNSNRPAGVTFIALGCTLFTIALNRRKKQK